jgi:transcriptional regulator with XRE-family HTH domain
LTAQLTPTVLKTYMVHMKAARIVAENVAALLKREGYKQTDLAQACRRSDPWVSQFLRGERTWQLDDLDKVADFFGLDTFQLFRPGIAQRTERRSVQRRAGVERRVRHDVRNTQQLEAQIAPIRPRKGASEGTTALQAQHLHALIAEFARRVGVLIPPSDARGQVASPRRRGAAVSHRDRTVRGSGPAGSGE